MCWYLDIFCCRDKPERWPTSCVECLMSFMGHSNVAELACLQKYRYGCTVCLGWDIKGIVKYISGGAHRRAPPDMQQYFKIDKIHFQLLRYFIFGQITGILNHWNGGQYRENLKIDLYCAFILLLLFHSSLDALGWTFSPMFMTNWCNWKLSKRYNKAPSKLSTWSKFKWVLSKWQPVLPLKYLDKFYWAQSWMPWGMFLPLLLKFNFS